MIAPSQPAPDQPETTLPLTRAQALDRLARFVPHAGSAYAARRNFDNGPGRHDAVSRLSAALRRRVIGEDEVVRAVLARHTPAQAEKFISEVFWRTYWKGWLEQRPTVWSDYLAEVAHWQAQADRYADLAASLHAARSGVTGIDCFDHWVRELTGTGYLHNWARMQFASIWVFTLRLPWALGAAFTLDHFVDADPASNTLSWRWVAGLHTAGKTYLADAERIARMTGGRFAPTGLATHAPVPSAAPLPPATAPRAPRPANGAGDGAGNGAGPALLLLTPEDLSPEVSGGAGPGAIAGIVAPRNLFASTADRIAGEDALQRAAAHWDCPADWGDDLRAVTAQAGQAGVSRIVTAFAPVGPVAAALDRWEPELAANGLVLTEVRRDWDSAAWPHCRKGFFALKEKIGRLIAPLHQPDLFSARDCQSA